MANVAFNSEKAVIAPFNAADQRAGGAKPQNETGMFSCLSVKNWPDAFKDTVRWGGEALARKLVWKPIEKRTIGHTVDPDHAQDLKTTSDQYGAKKTCRAIKASQPEETRVKPSVLKRDEPEASGPVNFLAASIKSAFSAVPTAMLAGLGCMAMINGVSSTQAPEHTGIVSLPPSITDAFSEITTPQATLPSGHTVVNWVNALLLGFSAREASEVVVFNSAAYESLPESQQTTRSRIALAVASGTTYVMAFVAGTAIVAGTIGSAAKDDPQWANLIELLEGVAYAVGARALHKMVKDIISRDGVLMARIESMRSGGNGLSTGAGTQNSEETGVELTGVSPTAAADNLGYQETIEQQAQHVIDALNEGDPEQPSTSNNSATQNREPIRNALQKAIVTLFVQQLREGGEVGLLAGLFMVGDEEPNASTLQKIEIVALSVALGSLLPVTLAGLGYGVTSIAEKCSNELGGDRLKHYIFKSISWIGAAMFVGLAMKATHEFMEVLGADPRPYDLTNGDSDSIWSDKRLPMSLASVVGYTPKPDVAQLIAGCLAIMEALKLLVPLPAWLKR